MKRLSWEHTLPAIRGHRSDPVAAVLFAAGALALTWTSRLNFRRQDANWDLLNYHAYVPYSLFNGTLFTDLHPASIQTYLNPYQDLLLWPLISGIPAPLAIVILVALQLSIFIPVGLIIQVVMPSLSRWRALGIGLIGVCGAMTLTELGGTMGDIPSAILLAWAVYLLLSVLAGQTVRSERRVALAGVLVGAAVALKYTVIYLAPGLLIFAVALMIAGKRRGAFLFLMSSAAAAVVLCAPWALVLQAHMGSPVFPLFNATFQAPRYPPIDFRDSRFQVTSIWDLLQMPVRQGVGTAHTAELPFRDARWAIAACVAGLGLAVAAVRAWRPAARRPWRAVLPGVTLLLFWGVSYVTWAFMFGIQRYAVLLEVLALPVIVAGAVLALPRLSAYRASLFMLILLAAFLARTTVIIDFGRRPTTWEPMVPARTIEPLTRYDAIVIGEGPLAFLRAVTRDAPGASSQVWLEAPFNEADRVVAVRALAGRTVGVLFYRDRHDTAMGAATSLGYRLTDDCVTFDSPLANSNLLTSIEICSANLSP